MRHKAPLLAVFAVLIACGVAHASEGFDGLVKMARAGVGEGVMIEFVKRSSARFDMNKEEKLYLTDLGVSTDVLIAAIERDRELSPAEPPPLSPAATVSDAPPAETAAESASAPFVPPPAPPIVPVTAPAEHPTLSYFYESMAPYGSWVEVGGVPVWRPAVAIDDPEWRPYVHRGHWVLTDAGWAWESDYSWGWAPFHYGRWDQNPVYGWVWTPDTVWAPAWVSWRTCETYFAWAPLPRAAVFVDGVGFGVGVDISFGLVADDFFFVPAGFFYEPVLWSYRVRESVEVTRIYSRTTIIHDNMTIINNRIVNNGPSRELAERVTNREIKTLRVADAPLGESNRHEAGRDTMRIYRPQVSKETPISASQAMANHEKALSQNMAKRNDWGKQAADERQKWADAQWQKRGDGEVAEAARQGKAAEMHESKARELDKAAKDADKTTRNQMKAEAAEHRKQAEESKQKQAAALGHADAMHGHHENVLPLGTLTPDGEKVRKQAAEDYRKLAEASRARAVDEHRNQENEHQKVMQALANEQRQHGQVAEQHEQRAAELRKSAENERDPAKRAELQAQEREVRAKAAEARSNEKNVVEQQQQHEELRRQQALNPASQGPQLQSQPKAATPPKTRTRN